MLSFATEYNYTLYYSTTTTRYIIVLQLHVILEANYRRLLRVMTLYMYIHNHRKCADDNYLPVLHNYRKCANDNYLHVLHNYRKCADDNYLPVLHNWSPADKISTSVSVCTSTSTFTTSQIGFSAHLKLPLLWFLCCFFNILLCIWILDLKQKVHVKLINVQGLEEAGVDGGGIFR